MSHKSHQKLVGQAVAGNHIAMVLQTMQGNGQRRAGAGSSFLARFPAHVSGLHLQ